MKRLRARHREPVDTLPERATTWRLASFEQVKPQQQDCLLLGDFAHCRAGSLFSKMMDLAGIGIVTDASAPYSFAIKWAPWSEYSIPDEVRSQLNGERVINDTHFFCAKSNVSKHFEETFGYRSSVDPSTFHGLCVAKSDRNSLHDGRVMVCPQGPPEPGTVYDVLVDNDIDDEYVEDIRVPIVGDRIPYVHLKYRPKSARFSNKNSYVALAGKRQVFTADELASILRFARALGLDYGELDILRDRPTGKLYIVDVNNTPYGPANHMEPRDAELTVALLADAFSDAFLTRKGVTH
jgi:hypothetical protein